MHWLKLSITTDSEHATEAADWLTLLGAQAVSLLDAADEPLFQNNPQQTPLWREVIVQGLFTADTKITPIIKQFKQLFSTTPIKYKTELLAEQDWVRITQQQFSPQRFGSKLWICPRWHDAKQLSGPVVRIDPGLAFGTGKHPTTALCLQWLVENPPIGKQVIDYGCGSGILALAALALGANQVFAVDHDPQALEATRNNAKLNTFATSKKLKILPAEKITAIKVDLIIANILATPLIELAPKILGLIKTEGELVLSGLLEKDIDPVTSAYKPSCLIKTKTFQEDWVLLNFKCTSRLC